MTFDDILGQVILLLRREGRVSYGALKRRFDIDDAYLRDLREELVEAKRLAADEGGKVLVWTGQQADVLTPAGYTPPHLVQKILTTRSALEGERKQVTVLFCDVADSSALARRLDPEVMHEVIGRILRVIAQGVHRYEGSVNQYLGDGVMALFGAPVALEDHALRAVQAALTIQETIAGLNVELQRSRGVEVNLRQGLNTGPVVVGRIGDDLRMDYTAIGNTTYVAARLQTIAEPATILISDATYRQVEGYVRTEPCGPVELKGQEDLVTVHRIVGRRRRRTRVEIAAERGLTPLVGRRRELELLNDRLVHAQTGHGQVVGIVGEAGVGKSRLIFEFQRSVEPGRVTWLSGQCVGYGQSTPYVPLLEILRANFHIDEGDNPHQIHEKLRRGVSELDLEIDRVLPHLIDLLVPGADDEALGHLGAKDRRQQAFEAVRLLTVAGSRRRPIVVVLEDLHWIDQTSEDYLSFVIESLGGLSVLLLTTFRPGYTVRWADKSYYTQIALDILSGEEADAIVASVLDGSPPPPDVLRLIHDKTGGNPLFVEEVVRSLLERGTLVRADGSVRWAGDAVVELPATVQDIMRARIDRLDDPVKRTVQTAAVIGREFGVRLLTRLSDAVAEVQPYLETLKHLEFIHEKRVFPELEYAFKHAVVRDVAYQTLLAQRRQTLHGAIAEAMEELYAEQLEEQAAILAYHYARSTRGDKAASYALRAGDRASRLYGRAEATSYYLQALAGARALPDSSAARAMQVDAAVGLAGVSQTRQDLERDGRNLAQAQELAEGLGDRRRLAQVLYWRGRGQYVTGSFPAALEYAQRSLSLADALGDEALAAPAVNLVGRVHWLQGDFGEAADLLARSAEQMRRIGDGNEEATAAGFAGWALAFLGRLPEALAYAERGLDLARQLGNPFAEAAARMYRAAIHDQQGAWTEALADYAEAQRLAESAGDLFRVYLVKGLAGRAHAMAGDPSRARVVLEDGLALGRQLGTTFVRAWTATYLAACLLELGEPERAEASARDALELAGTAGDKYGQFMASRTLGEILTRRRPPDLPAAERALDEARRLQERLGARPELARTLVALADLRRLQGRPDAARTHLAEAAATFAELGMTWDRARAERALGALA